MFGFKITLNETTPNIMKKLLVLIAIILCAISSFAQLPSFPNNPSGTANSSTLTTNNGAFTSLGYKFKYYPDTATANLVPYLKFTPHIAIKVGDDFYLRNTAATKWNLVGGGDVVNINYLDSIININNVNYFGNCINKVISGSVTIDSLFAGRTTDITFQLASCSTYTVPATVFNITGSGIADRYTIIVADTLGNIFPIDGLTNPADIPNIVDDESQILLAVYFIPAGSTTPQGVSNEWIYREGDNDWLNIRRTVTTGFDSAYTVNPFAGLLSLRIPSMVAGQYFEWHFGGLKTAADYDFFTAHLRKSGTIANGTKWSITFYNGNSVATSNAAVITNGSYGYNRTASGTYESIAIPFGTWNFINPLFDRVRVTFIGNTSVSTQWDDVKLQAGGSNTNGGNFVQTVNGVGGSNVNIRTLDSTYLNADSSRQVFINTYTGDTISAETFVNYIYFDTCFSKTTIGKNTYVSFNQNCGGSGGGAGTVTSVAKGYGIVADGAITTTGTITADSTVLASKTYAAALAALKLPISDTAAMLDPYKTSYPRQAISLVFTTTGTSGAATGTYNNGTGVFTVNVPQYSGGGGSSLTRQVITSGSSGTVTGGNYIVTIDPASTLAAYTLTLPASPSDMDIVEVNFGGTLTAGMIVTSLIISPNSGQTILDNTPPGMATADNSIYYRYRTANTKWYRLKL